eukprot:508955-Amphidinium_carterae.2
MFRTACDSAGTTGTLEGGLDGENHRFVGGMAADGERSGSRRDRESLPKLEVKKPHDPTDTVHTVQRWLREAECDHALWTTLTAGQRAIQRGLHKELLPQTNNIILVYHEYLLSEQTTRAHGLKIVEQPLHGARKLQRYATLRLQQIRHYMRDLRDIIHLFLEGLEAELSAAALKEEQCQSNTKGRERDASSMMAADTGGKPSRKPSGSRAGRNPGAAGFKDVCRYYMSDN